MAKIHYSPCDKLTYKVLAQYGCQSSQQIRTCMNRLYDESYSTGSIGASLRKMAQKGSQRYRNAQAGHPEDIFRTPIADMQERLMKQWMFYLSQQVKRELLRIDLKK